MALLGLLCRYGPRYGYELRSLIKEQNLDRIADVQFGSIYSVLKRLERDGLVAEVGRSRAGNRPERVAFDVTEDGRKELRRLVGDALCDPGQAERPVDIALHFSGLLPLDEVAGLLKARLQALDDYHRRLIREKERTTHPHPGVKALIEDISAHFVAVNKAERVWTEKVLARVGAGGYPTPGKTLEP
jgi:DNA-binding PadR family transcriptional regulator